ncbi:RHS repeat-associated core domain-containing protein [Pseudomonas fakonensis]|uniref:RHS repeat-associated core domain-containing protein n=1 Tax=Pseudomonas fakonensis TaxID=2842355 RepID=A0ABX8N792_9PSED|nr:RHS repeat-associated core domain-containing protein [Pseudomonas fakonensis]QXH51715.1 RHS repeat-associated core domain-containing protein [Pseudomonas fakonensis]
MATRLFYQGKKLHTLINDGISSSLLHTANIAHAEYRTTAQGVESLLMATNEPGSVLQARSSSDRVQVLSYTAYGDAPAHLSVMQTLMFNSEWREPITGGYFLGNGYRLLNTVLRRFNLPDNMSPFGAGGLNAYAYCSGDPINKTDPSGHMEKPVFKTPQLKPRAPILQSRSSHPSQTALSSLRHDVQPHWSPTSPEVFKRRVEYLTDIYTIARNLYPDDTYQAAPGSILDSARGRFFEMGVHLYRNGQEGAAAFALAYANNKAPLTPNELSRINYDNDTLAFGQLLMQKENYQEASPAELLSQLAIRLRSN